MITVSTNASGDVVTWTLTRPDARNAMSLAMWSQLRDLCRDVHHTPSLRAVVLRGADGHFSAGADIAGLGRALAADTDETPYRTINAAAEEALASLPVPTIAVIEGSCIGGGVQVAAACDFRLTHPSATFGVTPARLGIAYPASALVRLVQLIGIAATKDLLLTARLISAAEAFDLGLVAKPTTDLDGDLAALLEQLRAQSSFTQAATKAVLHAWQSGAATGELGRQLEADSLAHSDLREGLAAFADKRPPHFGPRQ